MVDDDAAEIEALRGAISGYDVTVDTAADVESAVALLETNRYCGLVLDLVLRQGSGFDVLHHLARANLTIPTVVVTGRLPSYVREMLDNEQVKLVFPKPVEPRLLTVIVLGLCGMQT